MVDVLDEKGVSILPNGEVDASFGAEEIRGFKPAEFGTYTISIRGFAGGTGAFEIEFREGTAVSSSSLTAPGSEIVLTNELIGADPVRYRFAASAGETITAVVTPAGTLDVVLTVYDYESGEKLLEVDDAFGLETLTFTAPAGGGFYSLAVSGYGGGQGSYDINLTSGPYTLLELFNLTAVNGWLDETGFTDYAIDLQKGDILTLTAQPGDGFDLVLELMDADDRVLVSVDDGNRGQGETLT
jgi:hypothetical protein